MMNASKKGKEKERERVRKKEKLLYGI